MEVPVKVKSKDGRRGYLVDWYEAAGGKIMGVVAGQPAAVAVGMNIPIEDLEKVE